VNSEVNSRVEDLVKSELPSKKAEFKSSSDSGMTLLIRKLDDLTKSSDTENSKVKVKDGDLTKS
jgi:hypothetical protein